MGNGNTAVVEDICMAFGGMGPTTIMAYETMKALKGKILIIYIDVQILLCNVAQ